MATGSPSPASASIFTVTTPLEPFIKVRVVWPCAGCLPRWRRPGRSGSTRPTVIGIAVGVGTGFGVVIPTEMTGGAQSPYWTMVMLTFFYRRPHLADEHLQAPLLWFHRALYDA